MFPQNIHATLKLGKEQAIQNLLFMGFSVHKAGGGGCSKNRCARKPDLLASE